MQSPSLPSPAVASDRIGRHDDAPTVYAMSSLHFHAEHSSSWVGLMSSGSSATLPTAVRAGFLGNGNEAKLADKVQRWRAIPSAAGDDRHRLTIRIKAATSGLCSKRLVFASRPRAVCST